MVDLQNELAARIREVREQQHISQEDAARALGISQPTYCRIENGTRALKGDELVILADLFGVRVAAISGLTAVRERARFAARTGGTETSMGHMRERLYAYFELDSYLTAQGVPEQLCDTGRMDTVEQQRNMLLDALISMVEQFCPNVRNNEYVHEYLRAQEDAFYALVDCGAAEWVHNNDFQIRLLPEIG